MNIVIGTILIWTAALLAIRHVGRKNPAALQAILTDARRTFLFMLPRTVFGLIGAGFAAALVPPGATRALFGAEAGLTGVAIGTVAGMLTPDGAFVALAICATALKSGAGIGPVCVRQRLQVSLPVPLILGGIAFAVGGLMPGAI